MGSTTEMTRFPLYEHCPYIRMNNRKEVEDRYNYLLTKWEEEKVKMYRQPAQQLGRKNDNRTRLFTVHIPKLKKKEITTTQTLSARINYTSHTSILKLPNKHP